MEQHYGVLLFVQKEEGMFICLHVDAVCFGVQKKWVMLAASEEDTRGLLGWVE